MTILIGRARAGGRWTDPARHRQVRGTWLAIAWMWRGWGRRRLVKWSERLAGILLRIVRARNGMSQPSLPVLARNLAAVDLELRITVKDYDSHDDSAASIAGRVRRQDTTGQPLVG